MVSFLVIKTANKKGRTKYKNEMGTKCLSLLILATKFNALRCDNGNKITKNCATFSFCQ